MAPGESSTVKGTSVPDGWHGSGRTGSWLYGFSAYPKSDAVVVQETGWDHFLGKYDDQRTGYGGYIRHNFEFKNPNALVVGFEIQSGWTDGLNGQWKAPYNPLLANNGIVTVESEKFRSTNWSCRWFYVDAKDYQFAS